MGNSEKSEAGSRLNGSTYAGELGLRDPLHPLHKERFVSESIVFQDGFLRSAVFESAGFSPAAFHAIDLPNGKILLSAEAAGEQEETLHWTASLVGETLEGSIVRARNLAGRTEKIEYWFNCRLIGHKHEKLAS